MQIRFLFLMIVVSNFIFYPVSPKDGSEFIVKKDSKLKSMSKNQIKEEIGNITRQAFNWTTSLGCVVGHVKIGLAEKNTEFYKTENSKIASQVDKSDGVLQIGLSGIQSCFSDVISNLVENRGFFKRASRGELSEFLSLMQDMVKDLNNQNSLFNALNTEVVKAEKETNFFDKVKNQFCCSANELKKLEEKIKGSKCLKKT
jgi:hypothetical protein